MDTGHDDGRSKIRTRIPLTRTATYFIADLHLGASCIEDPRRHEKIISRWLDSIRHDAARLYLLGDVMDYWYEYRTVVPRGYVRFLGALARLADSGVEITWLKGNHDIWLFDYIRDEVGVTVVDGILDTVIDGRRFVMEHGDGVGEPRPSYRVLRSLFRNKFAQRMYAAIHPRWTVGFAHAWSSHSRLHGSALQSATLRDTDPLLVFAREYERTHGHVDHFIFGHRHQLIQMALNCDTTLTVLPDAFRTYGYARWDGERLNVERIKKS